MLACVLLVPACSKSESKPAPAPSAASSPAPSAAPEAAKSPPSESAPAPPAPVDTSKGSCTVTVEGDVQTSAISPGGPRAAGTDYWMTPEEIDKADEMLAGMEKDKAKAAARLAESRKADPRLMLLLINCGGDKVSLSLMPSGKARYKDVPFAPGKYPIVPGAQADAKPGEFFVMMSIDHQHFFTEPGTLDITRFDPGGIAGTFEFGASHTDHQSKVEQKVRVKGKFDFVCTTQSKACKP